MGRAGRRHVEAQKGIGAHRAAAWAGAAVIVLSGVLAYSNSLHGQFVFDDEPSISKNRSIRSLWPIRPLLRPPAASTQAGRPVVNISLAVNYALGGLDVRGYHALNLGVHILAGLALFGAVRRTLLLPRLQGRFGSAATGLGLAAALIWTLHPLQTESVTYIVQRAESIMGLFYLLTLYCAVRGFGSSRPGPWYAAATAACALGMGSKEVMVSAPLMVLLYDWVFVAASFRELFRQRWGFYVALAATWGVLAAVMVTAGSRSGTAGFDVGMSWWDYAQTQLGYIIHYLRLCFWPQPLVFDYGDDLIMDLSRIVPCGVAVGLLVAGTAVGVFQRRWLGFLGAGFFAILAPSSSIIPITTEVAAEHRMYLPLAAVVVLVVVGVFLVARRLLVAAAPSPAGGRLRWALPLAAVAALAVLLGWRTFQRNLDYTTRVRIWEATARDRPQNGRAHGNFAKEMLEASVGWPMEQRESILVRAMDELNLAISMKPRLVDAYANRGTIYQTLGQYDLAAANYGRAIALKEDYGEGYYNRGLNYVAMKRDDLAMKDFNRTLELDPYHCMAWCERGSIYLRAGRYDEAIADYTRSLQANPAYGIAYYNRAVAYYDLRRYDEAWADIAMCRRLGATPVPELIRMLTQDSGRSQ